MNSTPSSSDQYAPFQDSPANTQSFNKSVFICETLLDFPILSHSLVPCTAFPLLVKGLRPKTFNGLYFIHNPLFSWCWHYQHTKPRPILNLTTLDTPSDNVIINCLHEHFMSDNIYTGICMLTLIIVNPHKYVLSNANSVLHNYAAGCRDTTPGRIPLLPHIFQLTNNAYCHMRWIKQDQSILFRCIHYRCIPH